ncbi:SDR family oxidoreductase [Calditerricola satsumensis]|uniref:Epimerase n=2 Tax=Calditerricola satsumensis TaxID=373054 RepID=A0A8J3FA62_9BACI|nr:epimerase [Calditerricola satsumensis]
MDKMKMEFQHEKKPVSLITGAAGFLGSHLVDRLLAEEHFVVGVDNLSTGNLKNLDHVISRNDFLFVAGDITGEMELPDLKYDYVWHLASPASPKDYRRLSIETMMVNAIGTKKMLDLALAHNAKFLLASTSEAYGDPQVHPQPEEYWGNVNPIGERACYDESKRFAEALTMEYHRRYDLDVRIVRIFNTYGPRMQINDGRVVPNFICQALRGEPLTVYGDGSQTRSFVFVQDEVEGIFRAMTCHGTKGEVFNIGNPEEYSILEFARLIAQICGVELNVVYKPLPPDDPRKRCPDISKAKRVLNWEPVTPLEKGLRITLDYFSSVLRETITR